MTYKFVRIPVYAVVVFVVLVVTTPPGVLYASVQISNSKAREAIHQSELRDCDEIRLDLEVYRENPPSTKAGIALRDRKAERYALLGCTPPQGK